MKVKDPLKYRYTGAQVSLNSYLCPLSFQVVFIPYEGKGISESLPFAK